MNRTRSTTVRCSNTTIGVQNLKLRRFSERFP